VSNTIIYGEMEMTGGHLWLFRGRISNHSHRETENNHENLLKDSRYNDRIVCFPNRNWVFYLCAYLFRAVANTLQ
jgi:hypothetical protein